MTDTIDATDAIDSINPTNPTDTTHSIRTFSRLMGVSVHTLRYYEQEGLLQPQRDSGNRRRYTAQDQTWMAFILRLKATGMPLRDIRRYAQLRAAGASTLSERLALLVQHRQTLQQQIVQLQDHQQHLDEKIAWYQVEIKKRK